MQALIAKYYKSITAVLGVLAIGTAFYTGFLEGKQASTTQPVTLSCKDNVLEKLSIPLEKIVNGATAHADSQKPSTDTAVQGKYVGSKNSTKYYSPSCKAVKRIKPANYIWFDSAQDAQIQGYTPGKC